VFSQFTRIVDLFNFPNLTRIGQGFRYYSLANYASREKKCGDTYLSRPSRMPTAYFRLSRGDYP